MPTIDVAVPSDATYRQAARVHLGDAHDAIVRALVAINHSDDQAAWDAVVAAQNAIDSAAERVISL
jgi:hypothetical protein